MFRVKLRGGFHGRSQTLIRWELAPGVSVAPADVVVLAAILA